MDHVLIQKSRGDAGFGGESQSSRATSTLSWQFLFLTQLERVDSYLCESGLFGNDWNQRAIFDCGKEKHTSDRTVCVAMLKEGVGAVFIIFYLI